MPTEYTAIISEKPNVTFEEFAMTCARAFGATIDMRDAPLNEQIPEAFEYSKYGEDAVQIAQKNLDRMRHFTLEEAKQKIDETIANSRKYHTEALERDKALTERYTAMIAEAEAWVPPSPDYVSFKNFILQQLYDSLTYDCSPVYHEDALRRLADETDVNPAAWLKKQIDEAELELKSAISLRDKDRARVDKRNQWIHQLRESLNK